MSREPQLTADMVANARPRLADGVQVETLANGAFKLTGPPLRRTRPAKVMAFLMRLPKQMQVELDDIGTFVLGRIQADRTMEQIAQDLAAHLKLETREAETALLSFIQSLMRRQLLVLAGTMETAA